MGDLDLTLACVRAYNDFLADWAALAPGRFLPVMAVPFWDLDVAIEEMGRCKQNGHRGMIFSQQPEFWDQPPLNDPYWDRLWGAAQEMSLSVNFHIAAGDTTGIYDAHPSAGPHANYAAIAAPFFVANAKTITTLIMTGICHRFPDLNFVSVESGVGWLPFVVQALDWMWQNCGVSIEHPEYELMPSEYFKRQIYGCFWFEHGPVLDTALQIIGPDNIMYETDFPHPTSMSPGPASIGDVPKHFIDQKLSYLDDDVLGKLLHGNAARVYNLDR
jgi:predicted TIM-barrel fold metal-dependent hydrolase